MYIKKLGFLLLSMFIFLGCVQNSEKIVEKKKLESLQNEENPSYDKYREGLENLNMN